MDKKELKKIIQEVLLDEMAKGRRGRPKKYTIEIDPDTGEEIKVPVKAEKAPEDDADLVYDKVTGKYVSKKEVESEDDGPSAMMKKWSPFRQNEKLIKVNHNQLSEYISDLVKEMTGTAALAVGGPAADYASDPEAEEISARTKMKSKIAKKIEDDEEEESEEIQELRKIVRNILKEAFEENLNDEVSEAPENFDDTSNFTDESADAPQGIIDMLKELMLADYEEYGNFSEFEKYWGVLEQEFGDNLLEDSYEVLAGEYEYFKESPEELNDL